MCDQHSFRRVDPLEERPLTAEELLQKKKQKDSERKQMEFIERYMR